MTLVPPVNVRAEDLGVALQVLRRAASDQSGPIAVDLGPVTTFMPASPVVYLAVGGPDLDRLARLRQAVVAGPMLRPDHWPWVPHVTLTDDAPAERIEAALAALFSYRAATVFDRVVLLEEREHRWQPLADACLGRAAVVGRGGLELEIVEGRVLGPDVMAMADGEPRPAFLAALDTVPAPSSIVLTGRRLGEVVGVATAWHDGEVGGTVEVYVLVEAKPRRQGVGRALLQALHASVQRHGWAERWRPRVRAEGFFTSASAWIREIRPACSVVTVATAVTPRPITLDDERHAPLWRRTLGGFPREGLARAGRGGGLRRGYCRCRRSGSSPPEGLWLDEALSVNIAKLPLAQLPGALVQDGSPPLYYLVLHYWMLAVRAGRLRGAGAVGRHLHSHPAVPVGGRQACRGADGRRGPRCCSGPARRGRSITGPTPACTRSWRWRRILWYLAVRRALELPSRRPLDRPCGRDRSVDVHPLLGPLPGRRRRRLAARAGVGGAQVR